MHAEAIIIIIIIIIIIKTGVPLTQQEYPCPRGVGGTLDFKWWAQVQRIYFFR